MKNRTLYFGEGLFETFRVYQGRRIAFVKDHLDRMADGCDFFGLAFSREKAVRALRLALEEIPPEGEARLRLNLLCYGDHAVERTDFQTSWELIQPGAGKEQERGVRLCFAPFQRFSKSPLVRFKTASYLENIFALRWARGQGFFDALFTNERNEITEGSICNVFFLNRGRILTPPLGAGLLPGVTRKQVLEVARLLDQPVEECPVLRKDLDRFDGILVTNSVIGISPVSHLAGAAYDTPEVSHVLQEGYDRHVEASAISFQDL